MKNSIIVLFGLLWLAFSPTTFITAQNSLPVKRVTIFKNATAMMVKEGTAPMKDGNVIFSIPEKTLFGTFFIGTGKDNAVKNLVFKNDTLKRKAHSSAVWQFLAGNMNKSVTISYTPT